MIPATAPDEPPDRRGRYPAIARACFHLNWIFALFWVLYLLGPDALGLLGRDRQGPAYGLFSAAFFLIHFILIATAIIALFVVIIEIHAERPVRGFRGVLAGLALPILSFLYFSGRFLVQVGHWLDR